MTRESQLEDREPVIVEAVRTAVGRRGGALREWHAAALLAETLKAILARSGERGHRVRPEIRLERPTIDSVGDQTPDRPRASAHELPQLSWN